MTRVARDHLAATRQLVMTTETANKLFAFRQFAAEAGRLVVFGEAEEADIVAALTAIAHDAHLADADTIRGEVAHAIAHPYVPPVRRRPTAVRDPRPGSRTIALAPLARRTELVLTPFSEIQPKAIRWLWPGRLPLGKQTIIAGEPGLGKSQIALALAAAVSTGGSWAGSEGRAPLGRAIVLSAEDGAADTARPRLDAAGADVSRVIQLTAVRDLDSGGEERFNLQKDLATLEATLDRMGDVRLVVIDPVTSYLGKVDSHKNPDMRAVLEPVSAVAERRGVAVVSITHFNKGNGTGASANDRVIGSIAFTAVARMVYVVCRDPHDPDEHGRRLFIQTKNNLGPPMPGRGFRINGVPMAGDVTASRADFDAEPVTMTANQAVAAIAAAVSQKRDAPVRDAAADFLRTLLKDGPRGAREIEAEAKSAGLATRTLYRAKETLGVRLEKQGRDGPWVWSLPVVPGNDASRWHYTRAGCRVATFWESRRFSSQARISPQI